MGDSFAEPEVVSDTLAMYRELWVSLYEIDRESDPAFDFANPSY
jgi:hypothetical protein